MSNWRILTVCAALLAACAHSQPPAEAVQPKPEPIAQPTAPPPPVAPPVTPAPPQPAPPAVEAVRSTDPAARIYFDFDKSFLTEASRAELVRLVGAASVPGATVRIEGNCDERGTVEYNIGLGQRRADAAKKYLIGLGVSGANITTISYGEERPRMLGHDEESWKENRRDDVFIQPPAAVSSR